MILSKCAVCNGKARELLSSSEQLQAKLLC